MPSVCISTSFIQVRAIGKKYPSIFVLKISLVVGKVMDFVYRGDKVVAVIVQFDDQNIGQELRKQHLKLHKKVISGGVPIFKRRMEYKNFNKSGSKKRGKNLWIKQVPLVLAFASTGKNFPFYYKF